MSTPWSEMGYAETRQSERGVAAPAASSDAPPSNRASDSCIEVLSAHVDSLELSYLGCLREGVASALDAKKKQAQSSDPREQAQAQITIGGETFLVHDKGARFFSFVIENGAFYIRLADRVSGSRLPGAYCQIRNELLLKAGPMDSLSQLEDLLHRLLQFDSEGTVSRIDLAVDFVTDQKIEPWSRDSWISRLREFKCNWIGDRFTGWQLGTKQNSVSGGLYDKSFEVSQVSGKAYLYEIWAAAGHIPWDDVWRLEGRFRREYLRSVGLTTLPHVLSCLGALWVYFTNDLIRLAVVTESDSTRARWPTMALWEALSGVDWNTPATALKRHVRPHRAPSNTYFARIGRALLTSKMARDNQSEPAEAWRDLLAIVEDYLRHQEELSGVSAERTIADIAANKARKYFIRRHAAPGTPAPLTDTAAVRAYREASRGT